MRKRKYRLWVHLSDDEYNTVTSRIEKSGLSKEAYIRSVLFDRVPREKPDEQFHTMMRELLESLNNANQYARQVNSFDSDAAWKLYNELEKLSRLQLDIRKAFLLPEVL